MSFYQKHILPFALDKTMRSNMFAVIRKEIIPQASGIVLEIGFGSGPNIPFYKQDGSVSKLYALEPSSELFEKYKPATENSTKNSCVNKSDDICNLTQLPFEITWLKAGAESIPLPDASVDSVVSTWTMCTISNLDKALQEIYRVLKPGGIFIFVEHGLSPHKAIRVCQHIGTPFSKCLAGGCHLNRDIKSILSSSPLQIREIKTYTPKLRPLGYMYQGIAIKK